MYTSIKYADWKFDVSARSTVSGHRECRSIPSFDKEKSAAGSIRYKLSRLCSLVINNTTIYSSVPPCSECQSQSRSLGGLGLSLCARVPEPRARVAFPLPEPEGSLWSGAECQLVGLIKARGGDVMLNRNVNTRDTDLLTYPSLELPCTRSSSSSSGRD
jgi:hypothetical protein